MIKKTKTEPKLLAPRLASVKSAFLVVRVEQGIEGTMRIDFDRPVDYTAPVFRELILNLLEDLGAEVPEIKTWTLSFDRKTNAAEMTGRLSVESVRKVLSLAHLPRISPDRSASHRIHRGSDARSFTGHHQGRNQGGGPAGDARLGE